MPNGRVPNMNEGSTSLPQIPVLHEPDLLAIYARFGVGDMVGVEGTEDRVVMLSARSDVVCPLHERRLVPDACRSCAFLSGEGGPARSGEGESSAA
jgi:hypothetical protein